MLTDRATDITNDHDAGLVFSDVFPAGFRQYAVMGNIVTKRGAHIQHAPRGDLLLAFMQGNQSFGHALDDAFDFFLFMQSRKINFTQDVAAIIAMLRTAERHTPK